MRVSVSESEAKLLEAMRGRVEPGRWYTTQELAELLGVDRSWLEPLARLLASKGVLELREEVVERFELTEEAKRYLSEGFPEERLARLLAERGGEAGVEELAKIMGDTLKIALANAARKGWVRVEAGRARLLVDLEKAVAEEREWLRALAEGRSIGAREARLLQRRGLVRRSKEKRVLVRVVEPPEKLLEKVVVEVGALSHELIRSGAWRRVRLRRYDVSAEPPRRYPGRLHFFVEFLEEVRDVMKEMGFVEVEYGPVETEFWTYDALFQPQYHPARSPTDTFYLAQPRDGQLPPAIADRVAETHRRGWGYPWDPRRAARLILRSHTTAVSARILASRPSRPFRFFTIGRVYRVETIDPKHLPEFHQLDGIAAEEETSLRYLLSLLAEFFERLGITEYRFRPAYFPFTEPSAEGYVRIAGEWMEVLGCGIFRPEVVKPLGIDYPVAAWGIGLERIAMALYGVNDIRGLYSYDVNFLRSIPTRW